MSDQEIIEAVSQSKHEALTAELLKLPQIDLETTHAISGGMYARTIKIPAGVVFTGAVHLKDHICIVNGDISVTSHDGVQRLTGFNVFTMKAGHGRSGAAHAETFWTAIVATDLTDLDEIENESVENPERLQTRQAMLGNVTLTRIGE